MVVKRTTNAEKEQRLKEMLAEQGGEDDTQSMNFDPGTVGEDEISDDIALQSALTQIGDTEIDAKVMVYQINGAGKKDTFLYDCSVAEFATAGLSEIQINYGAGDYRIRVFAAGRVLTHRRVAVGAARKSSLPAVIPAQTAQQGPSTADLMGVMMAGFKELAIALKPAAPVQSGMDIEQTIRLMAVMQGSRVEAPQRDPFDMMIKLMTLQKEMAPIGGGEGGDVGGGALMLEALKTFGPALTEGLNAQAQRRQQIPPSPIEREANPLPPRALAPPAMPQTTQTTQATPQDIDNMTAIQMKIAALKVPILTMAANDADPSNYAGMLLDFLDEAEIAEYIQADDWQVKLYSLLPELQQYPEWVAEFRQNVLDQLQANAEPDTVLSVPTPP